MNVNICQPTLHFRNNQPQPQRDYFMNYLFLVQMGTLLRVHYKTLPNVTDGSFNLTQLLWIIVFKIPFKTSFGRAVMISHDEVIQK